MINYFLCQKDFWGNFSSEIEKIYRFNFDSEYRQQYEKLLEDNNVDITDIIIPKIAKKFEKLLSNYIESFLNKEREERKKNTLIPKPKLTKLNKRRTSNVSTRNRKK